MTPYRQLSLNGKLFVVAVFHGVVYVVIMQASFCVLFLTNEDADETVPVVRVSSVVIGGTSLCL
jgi:ABC-type nickel/cobalt efflux system permease component RcnA